MLDILIIKLEGVKKELKDSLEVVRQQNECTSMLLIQGLEYIVIGPIWPFDYTILIYNIRAHEADVIVSLSSAFLHLHPT